MRPLICAHSPTLLPSAAITAPTLTLPYLALTLTGRAYTGPRAMLAKAGSFQMQAVTAWDPGVGGRGGFAGCALLCVRSRAPC